MTENCTASNNNNEENPFTVRVEKAIDGKYTASMRRFIQTISLYEADRCLKNRYKVLRPFQRKIALYDVCVDLIETLKFIPEYHRLSIMYRTASGKVPLTPELAWRRMKQVDKDIDKTVVPDLQPLLGDDKTHDDVCADYIQKQFEKHPTGQEGLKCSDGWEHSHLHTFMVYKMYYNGVVLDPDTPPAVDPNPYRVVPKEKPQVYPPELALVANASNDPSSPGKNPNDSDTKEDRHDDDDSDGEDTSVAVMEHNSPGDDDTHTNNTNNNHNNNGEKRSLSPPQNRADRAAQMRRSMLEEVREHLNLLRDFEDVISDAELNERKRELFKCLPPPPPSMVGKRELVVCEGEAEVVESKRAKVEQVLKIKADEDVKI